MAEGFIDGAIITSALTYLNLGKRAVAPQWHRQSIIESTFLLLHEDIHIIPRPRGVGGERGDYAIAASELPGLVFDSVNRKKAFQETVDCAQANIELLKQAWQQINQDQDYLDWSDVQRYDRWENQSLTYSSLFDADFVQVVSQVTGFDRRDVERIQKESGDPNKVKEWRRETDSRTDAQIANAGWVIGGFLRGFFYENLAAMEGLHLLTHPFRQYASQPAIGQGPHEFTNSEIALINIIINIAKSETAKKRRIYTWTDAIKKARGYIKENGSPRLLPNTTQPKAEERAIDIAKKLDLHVGPREIHFMLDAAIAGIIFGFHVAPWESIPGILGYKLAFKKSPGEHIANLYLKSNLRFKWLARSLPGRIERNLRSAQKVSLPSCDTE